MVRIIYKRDPINGFFQSKHVFELADGRLVLIRLVSDKEAQILDYSTNDVLDSVYGTSHHKTKINVKNWLINNGVEFINESRQKRKGQQ